MDDSAQQERQPPEAGGQSSFGRDGAGGQGRPVARPLVAAALPLAAGIASPAWGGFQVPTAALLGSLAALWLAQGLCWLRSRPARVLPLAFFWLLGVAFYQQALRPDFPASHLVHLPQGEHLTILGHLHRPSRLGPERVQLFLRVEAARGPAGWQPATGDLLIVTPHLSPPPVGTGVVVRGALRTPRVLNNPGAFDRVRYLAADGIFRELRPQGEQELIFLASEGAAPLGEKLRGGIRRLLKKLDPVSRAVYLSMLLGDQGEVTQEMRRALARTGTSHLLVINGLHLSMVAAVAYFLCFWVLRRSAWLLLRLNVIKAATLAAAVAVVGYAWVGGGSPSTQRAEIMVLAYLLLVFLGRPREVWSALALAALFILVLSPLRLFAISFQLSFAAVAALLYLFPRLVKSSEGPEGDQSWLRRRGARLLHWGREALAASAIATLATAPLVAAYFQVVSLLGVVVNVVAIPLVLVLALPLGEAAVLAQALSLSTLADFFLSLGRLPLTLGWAAIEHAARLPGSALILPTPTLLQIAAYWLLLALLFYPRRRLLALSGAGLAALVLAGTVAWPLLQAPGSLEVTCLDTYGGLAGVAVTPDGGRLVFSAAPPTFPGKRAGGPGPLPAYCHWRQFGRLDLLAAFNLTRDNAPELLTVCEQFRAGPLWYGTRGPEGEPYWDLCNFLGDRGRTPRSLARGQPPAALGEVSVRFPALGEEGSVGLLLEYQGREVFILPPERRLRAEELAAPDQPPEVLILPGSLAEGGEADQLLARLRPRRLVIYGKARAGPVEGAGGGIPRYYTHEGAVSLYLSGAESAVRQRAR